MSLVESPSGERIFCVKGAPRACLNTVRRTPQGQIGVMKSLCLNRVREDDQTTEKIEQSYRDAATDLGSGGFRSLGVIRKRENQKWELLGLIPLYDPPRSETASAIKEARRLGVSVKMMTGDAIAIAQQTNRLIGLGQNRYQAESLLDGDHSSAEIPKLVESADAFSKVFPHHKERIVKVFQQCGHVVAVTGDGVNDCPALRQADAGIALEGSSETAQCYADVGQYRTAGLLPIIKEIKCFRQLFQQLIHAFVVYRIAIAIHLLLFLGWYTSMWNNTLDLILLILNAHLADIIGLAMSYENLETPYSRTSVEWNLMEIWTSSVTLGIILAITTSTLPFTQYDAGALSLRNNLVTRAT